MKLPIETKLKLLFPGFVKEYRFYPTRKWRSDFAWPERKLLVEIEGGAWTYGRHNHPKGFINDMEKYNHASIAGFTLLRFTPQDFDDGTAFEMIAKAFAVREK